MTLEAVRAMSDEEVNWRVSRLCGFTPDDWKEAGIRAWSKYATSLNAMHEAEKTLTDEQYERYSADLWRIVNPDDIRQESHLIRCERAFLSATARQRCEAFILTMETAVCSLETLS